MCRLCKPWYGVNAVGILKDATDDAEESVLADSSSDVAALSVSTHSICFSGDSFSGDASAVYLVDIGSVSAPIVLDSGFASMHLWISFLAAVRQCISGRAGLSIHYSACLSCLRSSPFGLYERTLLLLSFCCAQPRSPACRQHMACARETGLWASYQRVLPLLQTLAHPATCLCSALLPD